MRISMFAGAAIAALAMIAGARADDTPKLTGVVELFTSQGCNSCPPADAVLYDLAQRPDIVALGYHVDYWDYLGWRDTMASPENTARQYDYRKTFGARSVYTPQAVVNGRTHVNGAKRAKVVAALEESGKDGLPVPVTVTRRGDSVIITAGKAASAADAAYLMLVYFDEPQSIDIGGGENGGRKIAYWNPVTSIQPAGMWHGDSTEFELPAGEIARRGKGGCAVLLQSIKADGSPSAILGAALIGKPRTN